jgi:beta-lactamase regulating signal transducer with metallopeptidase domain
MSAIENLLRQPAAQAVGWALLHFVWQGALVGGLTAAALVALRRSAADVRYVVSTIALSLMLTLPTVTAVQVWRSAIEPGPAASARAAIAPAGAVPTAPTYVTDSVVQPVHVSSDRSSSHLVPSFRVERWLPALVLTWLCGVVVLSLRLMSGWLWVQRMKSHGTLPAGDAWEHLAARLSRRLHIGRRVRLLQSSMVDVPTVIGWLKPVILLPVSALSGLTPHQLEAILAHELAHIRRHDYLVNLLQTLVETLLFYHPAVWWLSRRIRAERENCCDDLAVSLSGDPYTYREGARGSRGAAWTARSARDGRDRRIAGAPDPSRSGRPHARRARARMARRQRVGARDVRHRRGGRHHGTVPGS